MTERRRKPIVEKRSATHRPWYRAGKPWACTNGHPGPRGLRWGSPRCQACGERFYDVCPSCRGEYSWHASPNLISFGEGRLPLFCEQCGDALPWTKRFLDKVKRDSGDAPGLVPNFAPSIRDTINPALGGRFDDATLRKIENLSTIGAAVVKVLKALAC